MNDGDLVMPPVWLNGFNWSIPINIVTQGAAALLTAAELLARRHP